MQEGQIWWLLDTPPSWLIAMPSTHSLPLLALAMILPITPSRCDWNPVMRCSSNTPPTISFTLAQRSARRCIGVSSLRESRPDLLIVARGGGSLTALPIIETQAGDVSAYIPTNVISITDGQIFLETDLFNAGVRPAINAGISVSRVGGAAQTKVVKKLSGGIRTDLAQYRELAAFAQFASDLDDATRKQLERGRRVTELLKQAQYLPLQVWQLAASLYAANNGFLDNVEVKDILPFEKGLHDHLKTKYADLVSRIEDSKDLSKEDEATLRAAIEDFKKSAAF